MDRDKIARLLADLAKVGDIEKCRTCHCYVDVLRQVREDILSRDLADLPEAESLDEMIGRAYAEQFHGCLGCDPCLPVEPFNAFNELLRKDRAQGSRCTPASPEAQPVHDLSPSWPPLPGDYAVLDKDAAGAVCTLADEDLYEALRKAPLPGKTSNSPPASSTATPVAGVPARSSHSRTPNPASLTSISCPRKNWGHCSVALPPARSRWGRTEWTRGSHS